MNAHDDRLPDVIDQLRAADLIPPVMSVETARGGIVRVTIVGVADSDLRARLALAMGSTRWTLVEAADERAAGTEFRRQRGRE